MIARRAYGEAAKDVRRQDILDAASRLLSDGNALPTVARIAEVAGLAKGTLYLYFQSREEIFAALILDGWGGVLDELEVSLSVDNDPAAVVVSFVASLVALIESKPSLMRLDAVLPELKIRMPEEVRRQFHDAMIGRLMSTGRRLDEALRLADGRGFQLLVRSHAFSRGLWQSFEAVDPSCELAADLAMSLSDELREALTEYWRGALQ